MFVHMAPLISVSVHGVAFPPRSQHTEMQNLGEIASCLDIPENHKFAGEARAGLGRKVVGFGLVPHKILV